MVWQVHEVHLSKSEFLVPTINGANEDRTFTVRHFAGDVAYQVDTALFTPDTSLLL